MNQDVLDSIDAWVGWEFWDGVRIRLDGEFTLDQLEALIYALQEEHGNS